MFLRHCVFSLCLYCKHSSYLALTLTETIGSRWHPLHVGDENPLGCRDGRCCRLSQDSLSWVQLSTSTGSLSKITHRCKNGFTFSWTKMKQFCNHIKICCFRGSLLPYSIVFYKIFQWDLNNTSRQMPCLRIGDKNIMYSMGLFLS